MLQCIHLQEGHLFLYLPCTHLQDSRIFLAFSAFISNMPRSSIFLMHSYSKMPRFPVFLVHYFSKISCFPVFCVHSSSNMPRLPVFSMHGSSKIHFKIALRLSPAWLASAREKNIHQALPFAPKTLQTEKNLTELFPITDTEFRFFKLIKKYRYRNCGFFSN